jgi:hypothetical protein
MGVRIEPLLDALNDPGASARETGGGVLLLPLPRIIARVVGNIGSQEIEDGWVYNMMSTNEMRCAERRLASRGVDDDMVSLTADDASAN